MLYPDRRVNTGHGSDGVCNAGEVVVAHTDRVLCDASDHVCLLVSHCVLRPDDAGVVGDGSAPNTTRLSTDAVRVTHGYDCVVVAPSCDAEYCPAHPVPLISHEANLSCEHDGLRFSTRPIGRCSCPCVVQARHLYAGQLWLSCVLVVRVCWPSSGCLTRCRRSEPTVRIRLLGPCEVASCQCVTSQPRFCFAGLPVLAACCSFACSGDAVGASAVLRFWASFG